MALTASTVALDLLVAVEAAAAQARPELAVPAVPAGTALVPAPGQMASRVLPARRPPALVVVAVAAAARDQSLEVPAQQGRQAEAARWRSYIQAPARRQYLPKSEARADALTLDLIGIS